MGYNEPVQAVFENLVDAGCDAKLIERFLTLYEEGRKKEQMRLLTLHRKDLLAQMHDAQKRLDCLDFLLYKMRKEEAL